MEPSVIHQDDQDCHTTTDPQDIAQSVVCTCNVPVMTTSYKNELLKCLNLYIMREFFF